MDGRGASAVEEGSWRRRELKKRVWRSWKGRGGELERSGG